MLNDAATDGQTQARPHGFFAAASLAEFFENILLILDGNTWTIVLHADPEYFTITAQAHTHLSRIRGGELCGVGKQIDQHLHQAVAIGADGTGFLRQFDSQLDTALTEQPCVHLASVADQLPKIHPFDTPVCMSGFDLGQIQYLVDQTRQTFSFSDDNVEKFFTLL